MIEAIYDLIEEVRAEYAADPRVAVFEVDVFRDPTGLLIYGAVSVPAAVEALRRRIAELDLPASIRDEVTRIPDAHATDEAHAVVTAALAPMLAGPLISQSHLSQVLLGHRVLVLRGHGRWLQCRSADGYLGWIHRGYLRRMDERDARAWESGAIAPVHLSLGAVVTDEWGAAQINLPWGSRFGYAAGRVHLPDGSEGELRGEAVALSELPGRFAQHGSAIVETARRWRGTPYLWGGTTPAGADCSGLVQAVFRTHGIELPRDSDQQARVGVSLDIDQSEGFDAGDLLFFAEQQNRISHVAISTGHWKIIHSAVGNGGVREDDLSGDRGYERELRNLLVGARRLAELNG